MFTQEQAKKLDNAELCEELEKRFEVLQLCIDGILNVHEGTVALHWAGEDAIDLANEMKDRFRKLSE